MDKSDSSSKSFAIPKRQVWEAYQRVAANKGAAGVDGTSIAAFEADLEDNLYKIWNRMWSGSYFPPPVMAVEIPKPHGTGTRTLGVPTVADRIAQTVVALELEARTESIFYDDSYGYRPRRSALDAVETCRRRCQKKDWVLVAVALVLPARIAGVGLGEAAEEESGVGGPYEPFCDDWVAFIVDSQASVVDQPRPSSFHYPSSGEHLK